MASRRAKFRCWLASPGLALFARIRENVVTEDPHGPKPILGGRPKNVAPDKLLYSEHFAEPGDEVLSHACDLALEGIVSKRAEAPYRSGRTDLWLKSKCIKEQELVIGGYTEQPNHPGVLGILLFQGLREDKPAREVVRETSAKSTTRRRKRT